MHGTARATPELLLRAYADGIFPMAERRGDPDLFWVSPERRGIIPFERFHVSKRLARTVRSDRFQVTADLAFADVIQACREPAPDRTESWINDEIVRLYSALHASGHAHSIECWNEGRLAGGLYGVHLGSAFFGESMFSRARDASKTALVHLMARLVAGGFTLLDTQFLTGHLAQFGAVEIARAEYLARLKRALSISAYWPAPSGSGATFSLSLESGERTLTGAADATTGGWPGALALQLITQTS
ncbi:MAG: leucyl/phenylalanyl-tRNA--protein transferase [Alphaproteobacteria bacterium]|nr:leucyl/phenylalanyl-tRNA--protein transferase [Alphaproteobacteria bacterium]